MPFCRPNTRSCTVDIRSRIGLIGTILWFSAVSMLPLFLIGQSSSGTPPAQSYFLQDHLAKDMVLDIVQDEQGFMWFATSNGLIRYDGSTLKTYRNIPGDTSSLAGDYLTELDLGEPGVLWIGTASHGLQRMDLLTGKVQRFPHTQDCKNCPSHNRIESVYVTKQHIWLGTAGLGLNRYQLAHQQFQQVWKAGANSVAKITNTITQDPAGQLWLGTNSGLARLDVDNQEAVALNGPLQANGELAIVKSLAVDSAGNVWCGTQASGLFRYDTTDETFHRILLEQIGLTDAGWSHVWSILPEDDRSIWIGTERGAALLHTVAGQWQAKVYDQFDGERVSSLYKSKDGALFVGTGDGVYVLLPRQKLFQIDSLPVSTQGVYLYRQANGNNIWVGTYQGLYQYDKKQHRFHQDFLQEHPALRRFDQWFVSGLLLDSKNRLWIAQVINFSERFALYRYDLTTKELVDFSTQFEQNRWYSTRQMVEDRQGNIWLATDNEFGLLGYDARSNALKTYPLAPPGAIVKGAGALHVDQEGILWIGWLRAGLSRYDPESKEITHYQAGGSDQLVHNNVWWIGDFDSDHLCIGTEGGMSIFNKKTGNCRNITIHDGLVDAKVGYILPDDQGGLWLTSRHGLYRLDPQRDELRHYGPRDGMDFGMFVVQSAYKDQQGSLYFGGHHGLVRFHPDSIADHKYAPPVNFTRLRLFNKDVAAHGSDGILAKDIAYTAHLSLEHDQNVITFDYSALSYVNPGGHQYAYQLENFDSDWQYVGDQKSVTFTNLDPGDYTLHIKAANADGVWSEQSRQLQLTVLPPWYWSGWSKTLYIVLVTGLLYAFYRMQLNRQLARAEAQRLQELDILKTQLYTNITHEFRTPLTVISGMADQVLEKPEQWFREGLAMIKQNSGRLLNLVNQMLELSKLEAGKLPVHMIQDDIIKYLKYLTEAFHSYAETRDIRLHLLPEVDKLYMDYDPDKIQTIFSNLVSNAIKFTPAGGDVYIKIQEQRGEQQQEFCYLRIADTGTGIAAEELPFIFDRFHQIDGSTTRKTEGTGIGLALTKELVSLLQGRIKVKSQPGQGTEFAIWLPISRRAPREVNSISEEKFPITAYEVQAAAAQTSLSTVTFPVPAKEGTTNRDLPLLLLIEDNKDVMQYLKSCLEDHYRLQFAFDGKEGINIAIDNIPDIIISDVMMPEKDGFEVVATLKNDERTSHIPIILLTAKADVASRIAGLEQGADAYLAKPFEKSELEVRIRKLIELRRLLQARYRSGGPPEPLDDQAVPKEDNFMLKLKRLIEIRLADEDFGINELCEELGISRMQLHRKLKALTGLSTSHVIRSIRLQKARELLAETNLTVAEIAYRTGFKSSNYFSQAFAAEFGESPTAYRKKKG